MLSVPIFCRQRGPPLPDQPPSFTAVADEENDRRLPFKRSQSKAAPRGEIGLFSEPEGGTLIVGDAPDQFRTLRLHVFYRPNTATIKRKMKKISAPVGGAKC